MREVAASHSSSDTRAWLNEVLEEHQVSLLRYAASIAGREAATDIVQETFLRLCRTPREQVQGHVAPWLFRVCRNLAIDAGRDRARFRSMENKTEEPDEKASPADLVEQSETAARALRAVEKLPERQREAVRLKFAAGLSYKEIADVLDTSVNNVGVLLHRALKDVRGHLEMESAQKVRAR